VDGFVKVGDFGVARAAEGAATTGGLVGTVAYVAPEQVRGDAVDARTDLYAMGCVLYELLTGSQPFEGDAARVLHAHLNEDVPAPSRQQPAVTGDLDLVVAKATASHPRDRYASAGQMLADLERALATLPAAPPISELTQELTSEVLSESQDTMVPGRRRRKGRVWKVLLTLLVVAGLGVLGYLFRPVRVPDVTRDPSAQAKRTLNLAGLEVEQRRVPSDQEKDLVVAVHPDEGRWVRHGRKVLVDVSRGPAEPARVPPVVGMTEQEAMAALRTSGLQMVVVERKSDHAEAGRVIAQKEQPDQRLAQGAPVSVVVSTGPEFVDLANWTGHTLAEAQPALAVAGLTAVPSEVFHDTPVGTILSQDPVVPTIEKGSPIGLVVSKGPEPFQIADYKGTSCATAKADLEAKGLVVTATCGSSKVVDQDPPPGASVKKGQKVLLY
ncbi:MAG: PASTA domain-containing protein, partial [Actinomycetota bacterium]